jgi:2-C-methyl-D-erythritol 4-phosphate cytidylyltransferase
MGVDRPKQYLELAGRKVIEHTLERFTLHARIAGVVVCLSTADAHWSQVKVAQSHKIIAAGGGAERAHSVLNGLAVVAARAPESTWVLVHDAVRPCLRASDIDRLLADAGTDRVGGILAVPVRDTMKRAGSDRRITGTVSREDLWHAQTPQMFRLGALREALQRALADNVLVTDEAQAMERIGRMPLIVEGHPDNIKITRIEDLALAERILREQRDTISCA